MSEEILTNEDVQGNYYGPISSSQSSGPIDISKDYSRIISGGASTSQWEPVEHMRERAQIENEAYARKLAIADRARIDAGGGLANGGYPGGFPGETVREAVAREAAARKEFMDRSEREAAYNRSINNQIASRANAGNMRGTSGRSIGEESGGTSAAKSREYYDYLMKLQKEYQANAPAAPTMAIPTSSDINKLRHMGGVNVLRNASSRILPSLSGLPVAVRKQLTNSTMSGFSDNVSKMMASIIADATNRAWQNAQAKYQADVTGYNTAMQNLQGPLAIKTAAAQQGIYDITG